jgi:hypothetical protein
MFLQKPQSLFGGHEQECAKLFRTFFRRSLRLNFEEASKMPTEIRISIRPTMQNTIWHQAYAVLANPDFWVTTTFTVVGLIITLTLSALFQEGRVVSVLLAAAS